MAPKNKWELSDMLKFAVEFEGPIAIRYPRGEAYDGLEEYRQPIEYGKAEWIYKEQDIALLAVGSMVKTAESVYAKLKEQGKNVSLLNARFVKPIDEDAVLEACKKHTLLVTLEENVASGGYGEKVLDCLQKNGKDISLLRIAIPDAYVEHGSVDLLKKEIGLDVTSITEQILEKLG